MLKSTEYLIIIENKIYADDQDKQLERYSYAANNEYKNLKPYLLYLTLDGSDPSAKSLGAIDSKEVICISYATDIKAWLQKCAQIVYDIPIIRETIIQYSKLIDNLTGQSISEEQKMEVKNLLLTGDNFENALAIESVMDATKTEIQKRVWKGLQDNLKEKGYEFKFVNGLFEPKTADICEHFYKARDKITAYGLQYEIFKQKAEDDYYSVHLYIESEDRLYFGLTIAKSNIRGQNAAQYKKKFPEIVESLLTTADFENDNVWWLGWKYTSEKVNLRNFNEGNSAKLANDDFRKAFVERTANEIIQVIENCKEIKFDVQ
jgi:hypothetical protein